MNTSTEILTVEDVAKWAKVGRHSVYLAVNSGKLRAARVNGRGALRFTPEWVDAWLNACAGVEVSTAA